MDLSAIVSENEAWLSAQHGQLGEVAKLWRDGASELILVERSESDKADENTN